MIEDIILSTTVKLLAAALNEEECPEFDISLWPEVKKELYVQGVLGLVNGMFFKADILDSDEKQLLKKRIVQDSGKFCKMMIQQTEAVQLLEENSIPVIVLKGAACAQYYKKPSARMFGDIDLLVLPEDFEKTLYLFCENGYTQLDATDSFYQRHIGFSTPSGYEIELHRFFSSSSNKEQNLFLDQLLFENLRHNINIKQLQQFSVPVLSSLENGLIILDHINHHLGSGLGLRQVVDWMMYVKSELNNEFWHNQFKEKAEAIGMLDLCVTLTKMCQKYLGLTIDIAWCKDADEELVDELMYYVLSKGNYGIKVEKDSNNTRHVIFIFSNPKNTVKYLTINGLLNMQKAGLKPIKAFAWAYQIGHLLYRSIKRSDKKFIFLDLKKGAKETNLLKRLNVSGL